MKEPISNLKNAKKQIDKDERGLHTKKSITKALDLPSDVLLNLPQMRFEGFETFICDNHLGIIEYTQSCLRFKTNMGEVRMMGDNFVLNDFVGTSLRLSGEIRSVEFL